MLKRENLPPDNFPDDFESPKYHRYKPTMRPGLRLWMRESGTQVFFAIFFPALLICSVATAFVVNLQDNEPTRTVIVITAEPALEATLGGSFPIGVDQQPIDIPAKIDNNIVGGAKHGYRFVMPSRVAWTIVVITEDFDPIITLYDATGIPISTDDAGNTITYQPSGDGEFGIVIEAASEGDYTLSIMPVR